MTLSNTIRPPGIDLCAQYDAVAAINRLAGNYIVPTEDTVEHQISKIIIPEIRETLAGLLTEDEDEIRDGVADILFTVAGLYARLGYAFPAVTPIGSSQYSPFNASRLLLNLLMVCERSIVDARMVTLEVSGISLHHDMEGLLRDAATLGFMHGYPVVQDLQAVVDSNFTKFDATEEDARKTAAKYARIGVNTVYHSATYEGRQLYVTKVAESAKGTDGKDYPAGKWVKSVNFKEPVYSSLVEMA